jgi:hypothetical protein
VPVHFSDEQNLSRRIQKVKPSLLVRLLQFCLLSDGCAP